MMLVGGEGSRRRSIGCELPPSANISPGLASRVAAGHRDKSVETHRAWRADKVCPAYAHNRPRIDQQHRSAVPRRPPGRAQNSLGQYYFIIIGTSSILRAPDFHLPLLLHPPTRGTHEGGQTDKVPSMRPSIPFLYIVHYRSSRLSISHSKR